MARRARLDELDRMLGPRLVESEGTLNPGKVLEIPG